VEQRPKRPCRAVSSTSKTSPGRWAGGDWDASRECHDRWQYECEQFKRGCCVFGNSCWHLHSTESEPRRRESSQVPAAGLRFVV
ncbi:unnamed protein product, partial [Polarella glacialis]